MSALSSVRALADSPRFNFWGAVASTLAEIVGWIANLPDGSWWQRGAFMLTVFFLGRLAWVQYWEAEAYRQEMKPKFDMVFLPSNDDDSRPFVQTMTFFSNPPSLARDTDRRYRVGIVNLSKSTIPRVRVILEKCTPSGNFIHIGHKLLVMDSRPENGEADLLPSVNGQPTLYFDVVNECDSEGTIPRSFFFCFANPDLRGPVRVDEYQFTLRVEGGNASCSRSFVVTKVGTGTATRTRLFMRPL